MDSILELIITLVVGFFWLFGGSLFKKSEKDEPYPSTPSRQNREADRGQESSGYEARQEAIRDAIQRKIAERRQQSNPEPAVILNDESLGQAEAGSEPFVYAGSAEEQGPEEDSFSWELGGNSYEQEMQERLQQIEETKRKAEALKKSVKQVTPYNNADSNQGVGQGCALTLGSVRSALKHPSTVRAAFVYGEILGKPISLRSSSES